MKNFLTVTLLSLGMPMLLMGDEVRRTQRGNNNAYCQDNEISWFDWTLLTQHADVHRFVTLLIARRLRRDTQPELRRTSLNQLLQRANKSWHGVTLHQPDWCDWSHSLALSAELRREKLLFHWMLNAYREPLDFAAATGRQWQPDALAPVDRYRPRLAERHRSVAGGAAGPRVHVSGRSALGGAAVRRGAG